jgi:hypothetical protein
MAGYVINRIPSSSRIFSDGVSSLWNASGTTLSGSATVYRFETEGSLNAAVSVGDKICFNRNAVTGIPISDTVATNGPEDDGDTFMVGFWIKSDKSISFTFNVSLLYPTIFGVATTVEQYTDTVSVTSGEWVLIQNETRVTDPDDLQNYPISFAITITTVNGGGDANIYISHPIIWAGYDFVTNPMLFNIYSKLPEFIRAQDLNNTPYPFTLARFIEMCILHQGEMQQVITDIFYSDIVLGKDESDTATLSTLTEPSISPRKFLFWMAQFTGTQLINPTTGVTPWDNLPATWQGIDNLDGVASSEDSSPWDKIQDSDPEPAGLDEFLTWQVATGYYGMNAGSTEALTESVKRVLQASKTVNVTKSSAWNINITTKISETPDSSLLAVGNSVSGIVELVEPSRPLGVIVTHELIS